MIGGPRGIRPINSTNALALGDDYTNNTLTSDYFDGKIDERAYGAGPCRRCC
jgi:hypothetical protein